MDPSTQITDYEKSIFVGNLSFDATNDDVRGLFEEYAIAKADIGMRRGRSRGMAVIQFENQDDVAAAIAKFNNSNFQGRELVVRENQPPPDKLRRDREGGNDRRGAEASGEPSTELFVGNLPFSVGWKDLKDLFREAGDVARADVKLNRGGQSRGFGIVDFRSVADATAALEKFNGYRWDGRALEVRYGHKQAGAAAVSSSKNSDLTEGVTANGDKSATIFVGNLPFITTQQDLFELFETVGKVERAEVQYDNRSRPSGNAVVRFGSDELAETAIRNLDNYNYGGRDLRISFAKYPAV